MVAWWYYASNLSKLTNLEQLLPDQCTCIGQALSRRNTYRHMHFLCVSGLSASAISSYIAVRAVSSLVAHYFSEYNVVRPKQNAPSKLRNVADTSGCNATVRFSKWRCLVLLLLLLLLFIDTVCYIISVWSILRAWCTPYLNIAQKKYYACCMKCFVWDSVQCR
jgi:hypothetical protein